MFLTDLFPLVSVEWFLIIVFGFGIIIGSFLNVYIYRFHTGKSLSGHSHCLSCAIRLRWYELFPLFSYLVLRGRCRSCGCRIPSRYFLVELLTGLLFVGGLFIASSLVEFIIVCLIFSVLIVITVYDFYHFIIPDSLTFVLSILALVLYFHDFYLRPVIWGEFAIGLATAIGGALFFFCLWVVSKGKWLGFGDVKLALPLGFLVGPEFVFSFVVLSFWVGAVISVGLLLIGKIKRGKSHLHLLGPDLTMKSAVPFAPFLVASCLIIIFTHFNVLDLFSFN